VEIDVKRFSVMTEIDRSFWAEGQSATGPTQSMTYAGPRDVDLGRDLAFKLKVRIAEVGI
jgi:hypothetical protein